MLKIKVDNDSSTDIYLNSDILDVVIKFCEKTKHDLNSDSLKLSNIENLSDHMPFKCFEIVFDENISNYLFCSYVRNEIFCIELDKGGIDCFLKALYFLKNEFASKGFSHYHFMTEGWAGNELTNTTPSHSFLINMLTIYISK